MLGAVAACGREPLTAPRADAPPPPALAGSCRGSIGQYCQSAGGACPTYDEAVARRAALCSRPGAWTVQEDRCPGTYRSVVWREPLLGGGEEYFGSDGRLLGVFLYTDYPAYCRGTSFSQTFGDLPRCGSARVTEPVCGDAAGEREP